MTNENALEVLKGLMLMHEESASISPAVRVESGNALASAIGVLVVLIGITETEQAVIEATDWVASVAEI
jgi:hypothetical protein